jgi:hypothetical protein
MILEQAAPWSGSMLSRADLPSFETLNCIVNRPKGVAIPLRLVV